MAIQRVDGLSVFIIFCVAKSLPFSDFRAFRYKIIVSLSPSLIDARAGRISAPHASRLVALRDRKRSRFVGIAPKPVSLCRSHRPRIKVAVRELARERIRRSIRTDALP